MLSKVSLGIAIMASLAGGGGALAANGQAIFASSGANTHAVSNVGSSPSISAGQSANVRNIVTVPTVPRGTLTIVVTERASSSSVSASNSTDATDTANMTDTTGAQVALDIVGNLQSACPALSSLLGATKQLAVVATSNSNVFQVTAAGSADGGADATTSLLVDTSASSVTSTDPVTASALSACARLANFRPSVSASGSLTFAVNE